MKIVVAHYNTVLYIKTIEGPVTRRRKEKIWLLKK